MVSRFKVLSKICLVKRRQRFPFSEAKIKIKVEGVKGYVLHKIGASLQQGRGCVKEFAQLMFLNLLKQLKCSII